MQDINLESLINKNLQKSSFLSHIIQKPVSDQIYPTITVSRDPGSGGKGVAKKIAELLKIRCFDKSLIELVAKHTQTKLKLVQKLDEKSQSAVEDVVNNFLRVKSMPSQKFIKALATVSLSISAHQPAVFLGRGLNFVLPPATNFRIRVTAPRKVLIKYAMRYEGHSRAKAKEIIDQYMRERKEFVSKYFSKNIYKSHYYDLVVNTEYLSIEEAAKIAITGFKEKFGL